MYANLRSRLKVRNFGFVIFKAPRLRVWAFSDKAMRA